MALNIPQSESLFVPQQPVSGDDTGFMKTMGAIANPTAALEHKQNAQIAQSIADIQVSSIYPDIQNKFLEQREQYVSDYKDALKSHRGMGRLSLNPQEELQFQTRRTDLMNYTKWATQATSSLSKVNQDAITAKKNGELDDGAYKEWWDNYTKKIKNSNNGGGVPDAYTDFLQSGAIRPKPPKPEDMAKERRLGEEDENRYDKRVTDVEHYKNRTSPVTPVLAERDIKSEYPENGKPWGDYRRLKENRGIVDPNDDYNTAVSKIANEVAPHIKYSREQQPQTIVINQPTPTGTGGNTYKPLPAYQTPKIYSISGTNKKGLPDSYDDQTGIVTFIPEKQVLKDENEVRIASMENLVAKYEKEKKPDKVKYYKDAIEGIKNDKSNYTTALDYDNPEYHHIDDISGGRNIFTTQTNKGGQKMNIPPKSATTKKKIPGLKIQ